MALGAAAIVGGGALLGGYLSGNAAKDAAGTSAQAQLQAAQIAADAQKFRPVGITTNFGSSNFQFDNNGYLTGAGYSRSYHGDTLKTHTDFNWNERLKLHRALSFIIYLSSDWKEEYNGALEFKDFNNERTVTKVTTLFNRCLIWKYNKRGFHGFETPIDCPEHMSRNSLRLFFYTSNSTHNQDDLPHRSLYWFDPITKEPYDIKS